MPCGSAEELETLITEGAAAHRARYGDKGLLGASVSKLGRRAGRKKRRVRLNPKAQDADGDGLVQEGTTAERPAKDAPGDVKLPSGSKKSTGKRKPSLTRPERSKPVESIPKQPAPATSRRMAPTLPTRRVLLSDEDRLNSHFAPLLEKVNREILKLGGLGRARHSREGATAEMNERVQEVSEAVEEIYGPLNTIPELQAALEKAFPNAVVDLENMADEVAAFEEGPKKTPLDPGNPLAIYGDSADTEERLRSFVKAMLWKASKDPEAAAIVGSFRLSPPESSATASVGVSIANKVETPVEIRFNPQSYTEGSVASFEEAYYMSVRLRQDLEERDDIKLTGEGNWSMSQLAFTNGDPAANATWTGFHEWAHLKGISLASKDIDKNLMTQVQDWVSGGKSAPWMDQYPELQKADNRVKKTLAAEAAGLDVSKQFSEYTERLGFRNVDISDQEQLRAVYRAIAARNVLAQQLMTGLAERTAAFVDSNWDKFDTLGGYANIDPEEGIAELMAFSESFPGPAYEKYKQAFDLPEVKERM